MRFIKDNLKEVRTIGIKKDNFYKLLKIKNTESFEEFLDGIVSDDAILGHNGNREAFIRIPRAIVDSLDINSITDCRELALIGYCFTYRNLTGYNVLSLDKLNEIFGTNKKRIAEFTRDLFKKFTTNIIKFTVKRSKGIIVEIDEKALMSFCEENDGIVVKNNKSKELTKEIAIEEVKEDIEVKIEEVQPTVISSGKPLNPLDFKNLFRKVKAVKEAPKPIEEVKVVNCTDVIKEAPQVDITDDILSNMFDDKNGIDDLRINIHNNMINNIKDKKENDKPADKILDKNSIAYMMIHQWDNKSNLDSMTSI